MSLLWKIGVEARPNVELQLEYELVDGHSVFGPSKGGVCSELLCMACERARRNCK